MRAKRFWHAATLLLLGVALFFRAWHLGNMPGVNGDEAWLGWKALQLLHGHAIDWRTNTGNLTNFFYFLPLLALHAIFPPSFVALRAVAVASGVLALALNFFFCRRAFDAETAWFSTLLLAVLPVNIAYSRLGWEPSQILGASAIVVYSSLLIAREPRRSRFWAVVAVLALVAAFNVHPMCMFLSPFTAIAIWQRWRDKSLRILLLRERVMGALFWAGTLTAAGMFWLAAGDIVSRYVRYAHHREGAGFFGWGVLRLLSGSSTYQAMTGVAPSQLLFSDAAAGLLLFAVVLGGFGLRRTRLRPSTDKILTRALCMGLIAFVILLGETGFEPGRIRYALWMVLPLVLLFARAIIHLCSRAPRCKVAVRCGLLALCALLLTGFWVRYFQVFLRSGGSGEASFQTAAVEPRLATLRLIMQKHNPRRTVVIASSNWWLYWPVAYQAYSLPRVKTIFFDAAPQREEALSRKQHRADVWIVEFAATAAADERRAKLRNDKIPFGEYSTRAADGHPVVAIFHIPPS